MAPRGKGDQDGDERRHRRRLGGREPAEVDAEHGEEEQHAELPHADGGAQPGAPAACRRPRDPRGLRPGHGKDDEDIEHGEDDAGNHCRRVELGQRLLGGDGVDREQHGGRNQHVERAGRSDGAGGERRARSHGAAFPGSPPWRRSRRWRSTSRRSRRTARRRRWSRWPARRECRRTGRCRPGTARSPCWPSRPPHPSG